MKRTFTAFLRDHWIKNKLSGSFQSFLERMTTESFIGYAEEWAQQQFKKPMNDAYDALREELSTLRAMQILAEALGLKQEGDHE